VLYSTDGEFPDELHYTTVVTTTNDYCRSEYPHETITDDMICASDTGDHEERDHCQADTGGPMATKVNGQYQVIGLMSWGYSCAIGFAGVYHRIGYYADWITSVIVPAEIK